MELILDCKTRLNSLLTMIERFVVLKYSLSKVLLDVSCNINIYVYEWEVFLNNRASLFIKLHFHITVAKYWLHFCTWERYTMESPSNGHVLDMTSRIVRFSEAGPSLDHNTQYASF